MTPEHKFKLYAMVVSCIFIMGVFWIAASFTQSNLDTGELILSIVTVLSSLISILGIEFASPKNK